MKSPILIPWGYPSPGNCPVLRDGLRRAITDRGYYWNPQEDITSYEMAIAVGYLIDGAVLMFEEQLAALPEQIRRHWSKFNEQT